jgi:predicted ATP-dependent endonuclease of OLD family
MAHIVEFSVSGLAGRDQPYECKLNRDINVFFGLNGTGKTTLLKVLHSALSGKTEILNNLPIQGATVQMYSIKFKTNFTRTLKQVRAEIPDSPIIDVSSDQPALFEKDFIYWVDASHHLANVGGATRGGQSRFVWDTIPEESTFSGSWTHQYLPTARLYHQIRGGIVKPSAKTEEELDKQYAAILQSVWQNYTADLNRSIRKIQEQTLADVLRTSLSPSQISDNTEEEFEAHKTYQRVSNFFRRQPSLVDVLGPEEQFVARYSEDMRVRSIVRDIEKVERQIAEITRPQERLRDLIQRMYIGNKIVTFEEKEISIEIRGKGKISLPGLSSGEKHLLLICIDALMAERNSYIIDEPELSMHIDWQHQLINSLMDLNPRMQLIAATHSPEIMAELPDDKIFRV